MVDARRVAVRRKLVLAVGTVTRSVGASGEVVVGSGESSSEECRDGHIYIAARRPRRTRWGVEGGGPSWQQEKKH